LAEGPPGWGWTKKSTSGPHPAWVRSDGTVWINGVYYTPQQAQPQPQLPASEESKVDDAIQAQHDRNEEALEGINEIAETMETALETAQAGMILVGSVLIPGPDDIVLGGILGKKGLEWAWDGAKWFIRNKKSQKVITDKELKELAQDCARRRSNPSNMENIFTKEMHQNSKVIARGKDIDKIDEIVDKFGGTRKGWVKKKGWDASGQEWHWYEHHGIGKAGVKPAGCADPF
jgi:hypothetical protein